MLFVAKVIDSAGLFDRAVAKFYCFLKKLDKLVASAHSGSQRRQPGRDDSGPIAVDLSFPDISGFRWKEGSEMEVSPSQRRNTLPMVLEVDC